MKYDPESPAMTDWCAERHQTTARCLIYKSFYHSFRRLGNKNDVDADIYIWVCKEPGAWLCLWMQYFLQYRSVFLFAFLPLQLQTVMLLKPAHWAIFVSELDLLQSALSWFPECADSVTLFFTNTLSSASLCYWNSVTETHTSTVILSCSSIQTSHPFV